jgi:hypothetical protein
VKWKPRLTVKGKVSLFQCGRCKRRYSNPLTHVCKVGRAQVSKREQREWDEFQRRGER